MLGWVWVAGHSEALRLEIAWKRLPRDQRITALRAGIREMKVREPGQETRA